MAKCRTSCPSFSLQTGKMFRDAHEREGINARVQLRRPDVPEWSRHVWLDQVARVEHLDLSMVGKS